MSYVSLRGRMIRGTAYSLSAIVVSKIAYAVNSVVVSRMLGSENLGVLVILWNVLALAGIFATCGMPAAVVKLTAERGLSDPFAASEIVSASLLITAVSATATGAGFTAYPRRRAWERSRVRGGGVQESPARPHAR